MACNRKKLILIYFQWSQVSYLCSFCFHSRNVFSEGVLSHIKVTKDIGESDDVVFQHTVYNLILYIQFKKRFSVFLRSKTGPGCYHKLKIYLYWKNIRWAVVFSRHKELVLISFQQVHLNHLYWFCLSFFLNSYQLLVLWK